MANPIVNVVVSVLIAPTPSKLQKSGAFISQGATVTSPGTYSLLTQPADLTPLLKAPLALASLSWSGNVVTGTTSSAHGYPNGAVIPLVIAGAAPAGYNGTFLCTITGASTFTYALGTNPGMETTPGTVAPESLTELNQMVTTFFAQGTAQAVWVLELGVGSVNAGVSFLNSWITANPNIFYSYLVPRSWDGNANYIAGLANYDATTTKTYFFTTTTLQNWHLYPDTLKCCLTMIEAPKYGVWPANVLTAASYSGGIVTATTTTAHGVAVGQYFTIAGMTPSGYNGTFLALPGTTGSTLEYALASDPGAESVLGTLVASLYSSTGIPATEFSMAAPFRVTLNYDPGPANKVTPLNFAFLTGVTPFPLQGNAALLATLNAGNVNVVGTGYQGGISNTLLIGGNMMDGNPFKYWYSVDWAQINLPLNMTAALINGANNPLAPIDYNQDGINVLQQSAVSTMGTGLQDGLVLNPLQPSTLSADQFAQALDTGAFDGQTIINAEPFRAYTTENPNDYAAGVYDGISVEYTPLRGFESITVNIAVSSFAQ